MSSFPLAANLRIPRHWKLPCLSLASARHSSTSPPLLPPYSIDIKHIRRNGPLHSQNCIERAYPQFAPYPAEIEKLHALKLARCNELLALRKDSKEVGAKIQAYKIAARRTSASSPSDEADEGLSTLIERARELKGKVNELDTQNSEAEQRILALASALPSLSYEKAPLTSPVVDARYNDENVAMHSTSHVDIGLQLNMLDFSSAAKTSGHGYYFLLNEGAQLEQALIQYTLSLARERGWKMVAPPSVIYSALSDACGYMPRGEERAAFELVQDNSASKPALSLAATAEIPLAGMHANTKPARDALPLRSVGISRSYRPEAGARGRASKGLYRVHEFTKVELFSVCAPTAEASSTVFNEILALQRAVLTGLGLRVRELEMPRVELGRAAWRKKDMEAEFASRGWGEVASASECRDFQARRLGIRSRGEFAWTLNGTAVAVPRVLAAVMERGWDKEGGRLKLPRVLVPYMGGVEEVRVEKMGRGVERLIERGGPELS
ncbi:MAG: Serine--tRNA ligase, mitochondrial [Trizodia sp. TS-e1964]|nr:MAG: Serine--tRNA ligase, mitochondrial [Trizodia sp. TS-e1964]